MTFQHPNWLLWLLALVPLALLEWRAVVRAERSVQLLLGRKPLPGLLVQCLPAERVRALVLRLAAMLLLGLGAAGPQWGREAVRRQSQGSDIVYVVDVSASMQARDVAPSRMEEMRREATALLARLQGSRVGVVAFAGDAVRLCPLTLDQAAVRLTLETIGPGTVSEPGSDLGRALKTGLKLLPGGRRDEQAMVVWTDGEDLEGHAREAIEELRRSGLRVFVVGVGTPAGDVIPMSDVSGVTVDLKRDENGAVVRSRLDEGLLRELARATRGNYFVASRAGGELVRLATSLGSIARSRRGTRLVERPVARFPLLALGASGCLLAFFAAPRRRIVKRSAALGAGGREQTRRDEPVRPSKSGAGPGSGPRAGPVSNAAGQSSSRSPRPPAAAGVAALLLLCGWLWPAIAQAQSDWARGDAAFKKRDWVRAESLYTRRAKGGRAPAALLANLAAARAQHAGSDTLVERTLSHLSAREDRAGQMSGYNLGTLLGRRQEYDRALGELRRALERNPDDPDARWNYELLNRLREQEQQQQKPQPNAPQNGPQDPQPQQPDPQAGQGPQPGQQPPPQAGSQSQSEQADAPAAPGMQQPMTKEQAERLLGSLGDLERLEKQNQRRSRVQREKKGKDW